LFGVKKGCLAYYTLYGLYQNLFLFSKLIKMKKNIFLAAALLITLSSLGQKGITITFKNNYSDVYHLSLVIYLPDGKSETRVSNIIPGGLKQYSYPERTKIFILNWKQEALAMKGNDVKSTGILPLITLKKADDKRQILLTELIIPDSVKNTIVKPNANDLLGTWVIDLRPTPTSDSYLKNFKIIKIDSTRFDGEFYGYPFTGGFLNINWDKVYFGFTTQDQSGTYFHTGYIEGNQLFGTTLNESREFLLPWKGDRKK
jgi:hypothetical protein